MKLFCFDLQSDGSEMGDIMVHFFTNVSTVVTLQLFYSVTGCDTLQHETFAIHSFRSHEIGLFCAIIWGHPANLHHMCLFITAIRKLSKLSSAMHPSHLILDIPLVFFYLNSKLFGGFLQIRGNFVHFKRVT